MARSSVSIFTPAGLTYSFGPSFQWNILNYGQITNNVRLQDATLQQYLVDYQQSVLKAQQDVEDGIATYLQSRIAVEALRRSMAAANGALGISILEYQQGTRDFTSVLTSEQNLLTAENDLAIAEGDVPLGVTAGLSRRSAAAGRFARAMISYGRRPTPKCARAPIGEPCCRRPGRRRRRLRRWLPRRPGCRGRRTRVRQFGRRNFEVRFHQRSFRHEAEIDSDN